MTAVIIHPGQGEHVVAFQSSAYHAVRKVFGGQAAVYRTVYHTDDRVDFELDQYATGSYRAGWFWGEVAKCDTFVYIGHNGYVDGPILAYHDSALYVDGVYSQAWRTVVDGGKRKLSWNGFVFWDGVGNERLNTVKIAILGCHGGYSDSETDYAGLVAKAANSAVIGPIQSYAAGDPSTVVKDLNTIKAGSVPVGFRKAV